MRFQILKLLLVLLFAHCVYPQNVQKYVNQFITLYNNGKYEEIVQTFVPKYQTQSVSDIIIANLTDIHDSHGDIISNQLLQIATQGQIFMVAFKDDLTVGALAIRIEKSKIQYGMVNPLPGSSFSEYVDKNSDNIGFKFIFNDATIKKNEGDSFGVEALQLFPVSIEYCNQVASGKIKSSKTVSKKEITKYYLDGYDNNLKLFPVYKSSQSLGSLVKQNLATPSLAVSEYLIDLLGMDNILSTMDTLGISQDRTLYPASFYVELAALSYGVSNSEFLSNIKDMSDSETTEKNQEVHQILKAANSTSQKLLEQTVSYLKSKKATLMDAINIKNTVSTPESYADAYNNFITKNFKLSGNTNTIYSNFMALKNSTVFSLGKFGSTVMTQFEGSSLSGTIDYQYQAIGAYNIGKKQTYKTLAFSLMVSGPVINDKNFGITLAYFLINALKSPAYRSAAQDVF